MKKKITIWIVIIILISGGVFWYLQNQQPNTTYTTFPVEKGNLAQTVSVTGEVKPEVQYDLAFMTSGRLESITVTVGDSVIKKQKLATLDRSTLNAELRQAEAAISYEKNTLYNMKRRGSTYKKEQEEAQRANIKKAIEAKNVILTQIKNLSIYSPIDGLIIRKAINVGEIAVANESILTVAETRDLIVESNVPESDIVKIKLGQKAQVDFDALTPEEKFEAEIFEIEPASTVIQDVVYYKIKLKLVVRADERIKTGMSVNIDIKTEEKESVLMIPLRAVITEGEHKFVNILKNKDQNITERVKISTGLVGDEGMVEVKSGLSVGDNVITFTKNGS